MTNQMFLNSNELSDLTGKTQRCAQQRALRSMGIEHRVRPDGALIVSRSHIEKLLDGNPTSRPPKAVEPNWNAI